ncbi:MAG: glycerol-3-phosphate dehydrogenase [Watsoniomyces obsoletus]|nr:MAG: glycerol-3-phosphate dehydrogenase [Watsoniomyces obsoletus]
MHLFALLLTFNCLGATLANPALLRRSDPPRQPEDQQKTGWQVPKGVLPWAVKIGGAGAVGYGIYRWNKYQNWKYEQDAAQQAAQRAQERKGVLFLGDPTDLASIRQRVQAETTGANPPDIRGYDWIHDCASYRVTAEIDFDVALRTCWEDYFKALRDNPGVKPPYPTPEEGQEWARKRVEAEGRREKGPGNDDTRLQFSASNMDAVKQNLGTLKANLGTLKPDLSKVKLAAMAAQAARSVQNAPKLGRLGA